MRFQRAGGRGRILAIGTYRHRPTVHSDVGQPLATNRTHNCGINFKKWKKLSVENRANVCYKNIYDENKAVADKLKKVKNYNL